jgi:hypothetical protein
VAVAVVLTTVLATTGIAVVGSGAEITDSGTAVQVPKIVVAAPTITKTVPTIAGLVSVPVKGVPLILTSARGITAVMSDTEMTVPAAVVAVPVTAVPVP